MDNINIAGTSANMYSNTTPIRNGAHPSLLELLFTLKHSHIKDKYNCINTVYGGYTFIIMVTLIAS